MSTTIAENAQSLYLELLKHTEERMTNVDFSVADVLSAHLMAVQHLAYLVIEKGEAYRLSNAAMITDKLMGIASRIQERAFLAVNASRQSNRVGEGTT